MNDLNLKKIGKTKQENLKRLCNYPNGTQLIYQTRCNNCDIFERIIIEKFKLYFQHMKEIGNEYFKGNSNEMRYIIIMNYLNYDFKKTIERKNIIDETYNKEELLINELILDDNNNYICSKCNKIYKTKKSYKLHYENCQGINILTCPYCFKIFSSRFCKSSHKKICKMNKNK